MCQISDKAIKLSAFISYGAYLILVIALYIYLGVMSSNTKYFNLSNAVIVVLLALIVTISFIPNLFGFFSTICLNKGLTIYFIVTSKITTLISLILSIILLTISSASLTYADSDCFKSTTTKSISQTSLLQSNNYKYSIDNFIVKADQALCSLSCSCKIFNKNSNLASYISTPNGVIQFQGCSLAIQNSAYASYSLSSVDSTPTALDNIYSGLNFLETNFNCAGFCVSNYYDSTNKLRTLNKYLFSDVNSGTPSSTCIISAGNSILKAFGTAGGLGILIVIFNIGLIVLGYIVCYAIPNQQVIYAQNQIVIGLPQYNQPQFNQPQFNQPQFNQPQFNQPQFAPPPQTANPNIEYSKIQKKSDRADFDA